MKQDLRRRHWCSDIPSFVLDLDIIFDNSEDMDKKRLELFFFCQAQPLLWIPQMTHSVNFGGGGGARCFSAGGGSFFFKGLSCRTTGHV